MKRLFTTLAIIFSVNTQAQINYQWAKGIGGTGEDVGSDIVLDASGNVYVAGLYSGTNIDFDPSTNITTLSSAGSADIFFSKYDNNGNYIWAKSVGGTGYDFANAIALDASGNIYIMGSFSGTNVDFDPSANTATLSSVGGKDIFLAKYDNNGNYLWAISAGGTSDDYGNQIVVDALDNVYVTGFFKGTNVDFDPSANTAILSSAGNNDIFFAKYDSNGNYLWAKSIGGTYDDGGYSITLDALANVYLTGYFTGTNIDFDPSVNTTTLNSAGGKDIFFAKYDSNGNYLWAKNVGGTSDDYGNSIALDALNNVYITGQFSGVNADFDASANTATLSATGNNDIFFAKYDSNGNYIWANSIGGTWEDYGWSIALDVSNNVYITGMFSGINTDFDPSANVAPLSSAGFRDIFFAKYDSNGNYLWAKSAGGTGDDSGNSIALDASANVYLIGYFYSASADFDPSANTAVLNSAGSYEIFFAKYSPPCTQPSVTASSGSICAGQIYTMSVSGADLYSINNIATSVFTFNPVNTTTYAITGTSLGCVSNPVFATVSVNAPNINTSSNCTICVNESIALSASGANSYTWSTNENNVSINISPTITTTYFVQGTDDNDCVGNASVTVFVSACTGVDELKDENSILKIYPNPTNEILNIDISPSLDVAENAKFEIKVFDVLGKEMMNAKNTKQIGVSELPKGIYFIKIWGRTGKFVKE